MSSITIQSNEIIHLCDKLNVHAVHEIMSIIVYHIILRMYLWRPSLYAYMPWSILAHYTPQTPAIPSYQFIVELYCDKMIRQKGAAYIQCAAFLLAMIIVDENEQPKAYRRSSSGLAVSFVLKKPKMSPVLKWCSWRNNPKNCAPFSPLMKCWEHLWQAHLNSPVAPHRKWHARMNKRFECTAFDKNEREMRTVVCLLYTVRCATYAYFGWCDKVREQSY